MSRIDELIAEHCPIGVGYASVSEVFSTVPTPRGIKRSAYSDGSKIAIVDQGQTLVAGYTDDDSLTLPESQYVVFGDHTRAVKWIDFPFAVGADGTKVLKTKPGILPKFGYYALSNLPIADRGYNRHWSVVRDLKIPVPPLEIQREIVRILDTFSKMEAELEAELEARKQQYEHYRREVLSFSKDTLWGQLSDFVEYTNGKAHERLADPEGNVAMVTARFISRNGEANRFLDLKDVLTPALTGDVALVLSDLPNGRALARTFYVDRDDSYAINQRVARLRVKNQDTTDPKFVHYFLDRNIGLLRYDNGFDQTHLSKSQVTELPFPIIPLPEQKNIVAILEKFDAIVNDLSIGLPAELAARRQQYEYYRDKLLTFREVA